MAARVCLLTLCDGWIIAEVGLWIVCGAFVGWIFSDALVFPGFVGLKCCLLSGVVLAVFWILRGVIVSSLQV